MFHIECVALLPLTTVQLMYSSLGLCSKKNLDPSPSGSPRHVAQISVPEKTATINTVSTVPIMDICPSIADNPAILKSANLYELGPKPTLSPLPLALGDVTSQGSSKPSSASFSSVVFASLDTSPPKEMVVVKQKRTIFVPRLSCDTSVDDIKFYIESSIRELC